MKRDHLYVVRKNPLVWASMLCMMASMAMAIMHDYRFWPVHVAAALIYVLTVLLSGDEMLYRSSVGIWILGISFVFENGGIIPCVGFVVFCMLHTIIFCGKIKKFWLIPYDILMLGLAAWLGHLPEILAAASMLLLFPAIDVHHDGKFHPNWGDRIEGRRIRTADPMEQITAYFMPDRTGANNLFSESVEITELDRYVRRKRREGLTGFGMTHVIMAAYVRTVAKYPALNRFVAGQRIYSRGEDIALCMTVKKEMRTDAPDSLIKIHLHPGDTVVDVYHKFNAAVDAAKDEMENTSADNTVAAFMMIPRLFLKFVVGLLKFLDYFAMVPRFLLEVSPFHGSIYFTSMGSLGINPVYHHLYDFGTVPAFCAFGRKRRAEEIKDGEIVERKYMDMKFNLDERICDGFDYAAVIKYFLRLLKTPQVLENPPEVIETDIP